jgi:HAD superfamily hydrolase (TIGR01509 family)
MDSAAALRLSPAMTTPELIIFDCDGVLIDSEVISARQLIAELKGYGVEMDMAFVSRHFLGRSYPVVLKEVRERWGVALPDRFEADYRARLLGAFERELKVMPGVVETLRATRVPYCLATSSSPVRMRRSLEITGLANLFQGVCFTASEVARGKPAPDLFLHAAGRMGADPAACVVIEDSLNGVRAGLAAGMEVWRFTGGSHLEGLDLTPPEDARPKREFADFATMRAARPDLFDHVPLTVKT